MKDLTTTLSIKLGRDNKKLLDKLSKVKKVSISHLIEEAITEYIEDEMDKAIIEDRKNEDWVEWKRHG